MYKINYKQLRKGYIFGIPFFLGGILFFAVIAHLLFGNTVKKITMDSKIEAYQILEECSSGPCRSIYLYKVNEVNYECYENGTSTIKSKIVYYDSKNPSRCTLEYKTDQMVVLYALLILPGVSVIVGLNNIINVRKSIVNAKKLAEVGTLVKNLEYTMEDANIMINDIPLLMPVVYYTMPDGIKRKLIGFERNDQKFKDEGGKIDLIYDPDDYENYYIDFNIERI